MDLHTDPVESGRVPRRSVLKAAAIGAVSPAVVGTVAGQEDCFGGGAAVGEFTARHLDSDGTVLDVFEATGEDRVSARVEPANVGATLEMRGQYVRFDVDLATFTVTDYGFTAAHPFMTGSEDVTVFESKVPEHGVTLDDELRVNLRGQADGGRARLLRDGGEVSMSIQTKDHTQGGIFQMEPEPDIEMRHELGPGFHYFFDDGGRVLLTNGPEQPTCGNVIARESPQAATLLGDGGGGELTAGETTSRWQVDAGGRMGFVAGEDATE